MTVIQAEIVRVAAETPAVRRIVLRPETGFDWTAGAHIRVQLPTGGDRAYSLLRLPDLKPGEIALGVLREPEGDGGSLYMHGLKAGDQVGFTGPLNHFELGGHPALLLAGGIGVTPILSMAAALAEEGRAFAMHYAGRTEGALAFLPELEAICGSRLTLHFDDQPNALDLKQLFAEAQAGAHAYICGPSGLIDAAKAEAAAQGWAAERFHYELFTAEASTEDDGAFDVEIHDTGQVIHVPAHKTIIEALEEAGVDLMYDCQRGDCGICQTDVIEGVPDHRDVLLTDAERASNKIMQICVSRSKTPKLVLDL